MEVKEILRERNRVWKATETLYRHSYINGTQVLEINTKANTNAKKQLEGVEFDRLIAHILGNR